MKSMKQSDLNRIERIAYFEDIYNEAWKSVERLKAALEEYKTLEPKIRELEVYYQDGQWQEDYEADEAGEIPPDIKRGMLSEDGIYDLLMDEDGIRSNLK